MNKDYYKILGVTEFESAENIKIAYRKLARQYHPDIAGNNKTTIERFKEINEAYQILSNKTKKAEYDRARSFYSYAQSTKKDTSNQKKESNNETNTEKKGFHFSWEEFLSKRQSEQTYKNENKKTPRNGKDIYTDIEISVFEALSGVTKTINMLHAQPCPKCNGKKFVNGSICPKCYGKGENSIYKKFTVKIPANVKNKSKIRLAGEGEKGTNGGQNGDLYLTIHILESKTYKTDGLNILKNIQITPHEAVLGTEVSITTINGNLKVKIGANTKNGQKIRLANCGIVQNDKIGDMILTVEIQIPNHLTQEEIELYKKLREISSSSTRDDNYDR